MVGFYGEDHSRLTPVLRQTFQDFGLFQGRSWIFLGDLPGLWPFSRKVLSFLPGPSLFRRLFKEGRQDLLSFDVLLATFATLMVLAWSAISLFTATYQKRIAKIDVTPKSWTV